MASVDARPTLAVMAAGMGSRYGGLKQIEPVGPSNETIMDYSVYDAARAGFGKVVFIISKAIEDEFKANILKRYEKRIETAYVIQSLDKLPEGFSVPPDRKKPWGTGHAVLCCREAVHEPFAVINADDFYGQASYKALYEHLTNAGDTGGVYDCCMVGFVLENTLSEHGSVARGVCTLDPEGYLRNIVERTKIQKFGKAIRYLDNDTWVDIAPDSIVSMNAWGFTPGIFDEFERQFEDFLKANRDDLQTREFYLPSVVDRLLAENRARVKVLETKERWYGMTYHEDREMVRQQIKAMVEKGLYPENLWG
ncbi:MAG TPA: sugar phosphate nucleotidyltransferase [Candidatus Atribacteria bacterium]|nr:sugar phosphate nucleotidyltransferase [Candidatus Atribacteria bacterium]HPT77489.1 sugar phosphate nucleotidyltransferase [Candidatus Atribacteria bacterium]